MKKLMKRKMIIESNEIANTKLILLKDVNTSRVKFAFNIMKVIKTKDYSDGNGAVAWERLKKKYKPVSTPSIVKLEK
jgi:hypothetical protein